jgi:hypothetical protein
MAWSPAKFALQNGPIMSFSGGKRLFFLGADGKSTLYSGLHLAYQLSMPQTRILPQILKGSAPLFAVAVSSQEAV